MERDVSDIFCKFNMVGFCKFRGECSYKHILENCTDEKCKRQKCQKRHPRKCRFFFLKGFCKFENDCEYSHKPFASNAIQEVRSKIEANKMENVELLVKNKNLEINLQNKKKEVEALKEEVNLVKVKLLKLEREHSDTKEINELLISDVENVNERLELIIPGKAEEIIDELRESNAILKATLQRNNETIEYEEEEGSEKLIDLSEDIDSNLTKSFACQE